MILQPKNARMTQGDTVAFTTSAPGFITDKAQRLRIRRQLTNSEMKRLTPAQVDLLQRMLGIPGVISLRITKKTLVAHCHAMEPQNELRLRSLLIGLLFESVVCEEWQRVKQCQPRWRLAA